MTIEVGDFGLDEEALGAIEVAGKKAGAAKAAAKAAKKGAGTRTTALDAQKKALAAGKPIPALQIKSNANVTYQVRADKLFETYNAGMKGSPIVLGGAVADLAAVEIKGVNTYAKMLTGYREVLIASLEQKAAGAEPKVTNGQDTAKAIKAAAPPAKPAKAAKPKAVKPKPKDEVLPPTPATLKLLDADVAKARATLDAAKGTDGEDEARKALKSAQKRAQRARSVAQS